MIIFDKELSFYLFIFVICKGLVIKRGEGWYKWRETMTLLHPLNYSLY